MSSIKNIALAALAAGLAATAPHPSHGPHVVGTLILHGPHHRTFHTPRDVKTVQEPQVSYLTISDLGNAVATKTITYDGTEETGVEARNIPEGARVSHLVETIHGPQVSYLTISDLGNAVATKTTTYDGTEESGVEARNIPEGARVSDLGVAKTISYLTISDVGFAVATRTITLDGAAETGLAARTVQDETPKSTGIAELSQATLPPGFVGPRDVGQPIMETILSTSTSVATLAITRTKMTSECALQTKTGAGPSCYGRHYAPGNMWPSDLYHSCKEVPMTALPTSTIL